MRKVLFTLIVGAVSSMSFAGNGYFENLIDPKPEWLIAIS